MTMGDVTQSVNVTGEAPLLREADASLGQVIDNVKVEQIPIVGRSFDQMLYLIPGFASLAHWAILRQFPDDRRPAIGVSFNGMRTDMNEYELDGTHFNNPIYGTPSFYPSVETIEEFRVETQNFSSELSRVAGGQSCLAPNRERTNSMVQHTSICGIPTSRPGIRLRWSGPKPDPTSSAPRWAAPSSMTTRFSLAAMRVSAALRLEQTAPPFPRWTTDKES